LEVASSAYRPALSTAEALSELRRASNSQCDPAIVEAFAHALTRTTMRETTVAGPQPERAFGDNPRPRSFLRWVATRDYSLI
jgi:HD-GYP domain-containing protein (c-di-GMP phosphodiesterase class II)